MELSESYQNVKFIIFTNKKSYLWCASAEVALQAIGPKLMINLPIEDMGVGHHSEEEAINAVRMAVHHTVDRYLQGFSVLTPVPITSGIILRKVHFVEVKTGIEKYDKEVVAAMSAEARIQLAIDATVLVHQTEAEWYTALEKAEADLKAASGDKARLEEVRNVVREELNLAEKRKRIAESNAWIATRGMSDAQRERVETETAKRL